MLEPWQVISYTTLHSCMVEVFYVKALKVRLTPKYFFAQINLCTCSKRIVPFCPVLTQILSFYRL